MTREELEAILGIKTRIERSKKCWFIRGRDWSNYTSIKGEKAHRLAYRLCIGPLYPGMEICHNCDRRGCINPEHLFQGNHGDNMQDARNKGRVKNLKLVKTISWETRQRDKWKKLVRFCR
jgi:hypothetical protein